MAHVAVFHWADRTSRGEDVRSLQWYVCNMMAFHTNYEELIGVIFAIKISLQRGGDVTSVHILLWQTRQTRERH